MNRVFLIIGTIFLLSIFTAIPQSSEAQKYKTGLGLRIGTSSGITVKHFIGPESAIEGILEAGFPGANIVGLYELHKTPFDNNDLELYFGGGGHIGSWHAHDDQFVVIGADGIVGLSYTFEDAPINLSLDWKPYVELGHNAGVYFDSIALSARFILD